MATLINKMVSWAAREAEELAARSGTSLERAAEEVADKYGQKAFSATAKPAVEEFATTTPAMFLGDANAPRNKSLRELVSPSVEESITAREASRYTEPGLLNRPVSGAGEKAMLGVQESTMAREASRYKEPTITKEQQLALPPGRKFPGKSDTSASEDFEASLGELDTGIYPQMNIPKAGKAAAGAGLVGAGMALTGDARQSSQPQYSDLPEGVDKQEFNASLQKALQEPEKKSTPELKKTISQSLKEADKKADNPPAGTPPEQVDRFKEERDRIYKMYDEAKTRNEWLELAQILGQAVTQFGAAQVGMRTGRNMAGLQIPGVDYGARTAQEQRLLETRLRDIGGAEEREERLADRLRREEADKERIALERRRVQLAEKEATIPKESTEERQIRKEERALSQGEFKDRKEALQKAVGAQQIIASEATNKKAKQKAQEVLAEESAKAGLDLATIIEQSQVPGMLGLGTNTDEKAVLTNIKASLKALEEGRQKAPAPVTIQQQAPAPTGGTVTVIHKATGQSRQYPAGSPEAERAKSDPDFEVR